MGYQEEQEEQERRKYAALTAELEAKKIAELPKLLGDVHKVPGVGVVVEQMKNSFPAGAAVVVVAFMGQLYIASYFIDTDSCDFRQPLRWRKAKRVMVDSWEAV